MDRVAYHLFDVCAYAIRTMPECVSVYQWKHFNCPQRVATAPGNRGAPADASATVAHSLLPLFGDSIQTVRRAGKRRVQVREDRQIGICHFDFTGDMRVGSVRTGCTRAVGVR